MPSLLDLIEIILTYSQIFQILIFLLCFREVTRKSLLSSSSSSADDSKKGVSLDRKDSVSETGFKIKKLKLPRGITNIRIKLNHANPCTIGWRSTQMGKKGQGSILVMAGIRRDIFVWDLNKEDILRYF